jgi:hypothetical protein
MSRLTIFLCIVASLSLTACHLVGKSREQQKKTTYGITRELTRIGKCSSPPECASKLDLYGSGDLKIRYEIYNSTDMDLVASFINIAITNGLEFSENTPIDIFVYPKLRKVYGNSIFRDDPLVIVKISK